MKENDMDFKTAQILKRNAEKKKDFGMSIEKQVESCINQLNEAKKNIRQKINMKISDDRERKIRKKTLFEIQRILSNEQTCLKSSLKHGKRMNQKICSMK